MATNQKIIYVYDDFSYEESVLLGRLYVNVVKGGENYSFEYDTNWLKQKRLSIDIDPELQAYAGRQYPSEKDANKMAEDILSVVRENWVDLAKKYGLSRSQIEDMRPAFSACNV